MTGGGGGGHLQNTCIIIVLALHIHTLRGLIKLEIFCGAPSSRGPRLKAGPGFINLDICNLIGQFNRGIVEKLLQHMVIIKQLEMD